MKKTNNGRFRAHKCAPKATIDLWLEYSTFIFIFRLRRHSTLILRKIARHQPKYPKFNRYFQQFVKKYYLRFTADLL